MHAEWIGDKTQANEGISKRLVPSEVYPYRTGIIGGVVGGIVMATVAVGTMPLINRSIWFPVNLVAATLLRDLQGLPPDALNPFMPAAFVIGVGLHFFLSVSIGVLFALILPTLPGSALIWSLIAGPVLWALVQFIVLPLVNPVMSQLVHPLSFVTAHLLYSLVLGLWVTRYQKVPVR